jgi:glutamyl-tRNA synthetase
MPELKARAHTLNQLADAATFLFASRPLTIEESAAAVLTADARRVLGTAHQTLSALDDWSKEATEEALRSVAEAEGVKLGKLAQPLRAALTGRTTSPGIFDVLILLGKGESLSRISDQLVEPNA